MSSRLCSVLITKMACSVEKVKVEEEIVKVFEQNDDNEEAMPMEIDGIIKELDLEVSKPEQEEPEQDAEILNLHNKRSYVEEDHENKKFKKLNVESKSCQTDPIYKFIPKEAEVTEKKIETFKEEMLEKLKENDNKIEKLNEEHANKIEGMKAEIEKQNVKISNLEAHKIEMKADIEKQNVKISNLEDRGVCLSCYNEQINCRFIECKHWVMCLTCYQSLREKKCPFCFQDIQAVDIFYGI